ncbi:MAG: hypothetical protein KBE23_13195 [Chloroflexi bacterium]|nr:hypothetical protein [Chloroflexota bacterium]MBP7043694.1 hypothetical protein [Chloroflexota bacterium]
MKRGEITRQFYTWLTDGYNFIALFAVLILSVAMTWFVYTHMPVQVDWVLDGPPQVGVDWKGVFRPASIELLRGRSPYTVENFYNPPWTLLPLIPIALVSPALGSAIMYVLNLFAFLLVMLRLKSNVWLTIPFVLLSGALVNSNNGNIDGIVAIGFILPPSIGLFFILAKPQVGFVVALLWAVDAWRKGKVRGVVRIFWPVAAAYVVSFFLFGFWILNATGIVAQWWNASIWPTGIPIGLILLIIAIWRREIRFAIAASPFFAPYLAYHSWAFVWLGLLSLFPHNVVGRLWGKARRTIQVLTSKE